MKYFFKVLALLICLDASAQERKSTDYFKKWLDEDAAYIITPDERSVFQSLKTDEEKESFVENFWKRRDSNPATTLNETREEHYQRIAYANAHFRSGKKGWQTDRGMIYIKYGPPSDIDSHPTGGSYKRPFWEGGGTTSTFPFEVWTYKHLPGIGEDVEIEFVDPTMTGEYRLARDPLEKDALLFVAGAGNTLAEAAGVQERIDRIRYRSLGNTGGQARIHPEFQPLRMKDYPMERLYTFFSLQRPAEIKFKDLQTAVNTRVFYNNLAFRTRTDRLRISDDKVLVRLSFEIPNKDLTYSAGPGGILEAAVNIFGQVENLRGNILCVFEDVVASQMTPADLGAARSRLSRYQKSFPLPAGRYKLSLALKDIYGNKLSTSEQSLIIERADPEQLNTSTLMLTERILPSAEGHSYVEPFNYFGLKFYPSFSQAFTAGDPYLRAYLEVYDLGIDRQTEQPQVEIAYEVWQGGRLMINNDHPIIDVKLAKDRAAVFPAVPLKDLAAGSYELRLRIGDKVAGKQVESRTPFTIKER